MGVKRAEIGQPLESGDLRRDLTHCLPRSPKFENFVVEADGYAWLPTGTFSAVAPVVEFAQEVLEQRRQRDRQADKAGDSHQAESSSTSGSMSAAVSFAQGLFKGRKAQATTEAEEAQ